MRWTDSKILAALAMRDAGRVAPEIAEAFGVPTSEVEERLAQIDRDLAESERRRRKRKTSNPMLGVTVDPEKFRAKFEERFPGYGGVVRAAEQFGVTRRTVHRWIKGTTTVPPRVARAVLR